MTIQCNNQREANVKLQALTAGKQVASGVGSDYSEDYTLHCHAFSYELVRRENGRAVETIYIKW